MSRCFSIVYAVYSKVQYEQYSKKEAKQKVGHFVIRVTF